MKYGDLKIYWDPEDIPIKIKLHSGLNLAWQAALRSAIMQFDDHTFNQSTLDTNRFCWPENGYLYVLEDRGIIKVDAQINFDMKTGRIHYVNLLLPDSKVIRPEYRIKLIHKELEYILCSWAGK